MRAPFPVTASDMSGTDSREIPAGEVFPLQAKILYTNEAAGLRLVPSAIETSLVRSAGASDNANAPAAARLFVECGERAGRDRRHARRGARRGHGLRRDHRPRLRPHRHAGALHPDPGGLRARDLSGQRQPRELRELPQADRRARGHQGPAGAHLDEQPAEPRAAASTSSRATTRTARAPSSR